MPVSGSVPAWSRRIAVCVAGVLEPGHGGGLRRVAGLVERVDEARTPSRACAASPLPTPLMASSGGRSALVSAAAVTDGPSEAVVAGAVGAGAVVAAVVGLGGVLRHRVAAAAGGAAHGDGERHRGGRRGCAVSSDHHLLLGDLLTLRCAAAERNARISGASRSAIDTIR